MDVEFSPRTEIPQEFSPRLPEISLSPCLCQEQSFSPVLCIKGDFIGEYLLEDEYFYLLEDGGHIKLE